MILVIGATGRIGRELIHMLGENGIACRALVRDPERAQGLKRWAELAPGDLSDIESLHRACAGVDRVYLASAVDPQQTAFHANAFAAAKDAGVRHIVRISTEAVLDDVVMNFGGWHRTSEKQLEDSGMGWTHLRPCNFMHNMLSFAPSIARDGAIHAPFAGRMTLVDVRDIAAVAFAALTQDGHEGQAYQVTGTDWLSYPEIAGIIAQTIGREVGFNNISREQARQELARDHWPAWLIDDLLQMYRRLEEDTTPPTTDVVRRVTGREPRRFRDFAIEHATDFAAGKAAHG